jgi:hypothetical protein
MKITKTELKQIIREELSKVLDESTRRDTIEEKFFANARFLKHLGVTKEIWDEWPHDKQKDLRQKFRRYQKLSGFGPTVLNKGDSTNLATGAVTRDGETKERGADAYDQYMKPDASGKTGPERGAEAAAAQTARDAARAKQNKDEPWFRNLPGKKPKE